MAHVTILSASLRALAIIHLSIVGTACATTTPTSDSTPSVQPSSTAEAQMEVRVEPLVLTGPDRSQNFSEAQRLIEERKRHSTGTEAVLLAAAPHDVVSTVEAITAPFHPDNNNCALPDKIANKIRGQRPPWVPPGLITLAKEIKYQNLLRTNQAGVSVLLHTLDFLGTPRRQIVLTGASTYLSLNPLPFIDTQRPNFVYTLDCSGYLNASLSVEAGVPVAQVKSAAETALATSNSIVVARASIFPPIAVALAPHAVPPRMVDALSRRDHIELLHALSAQLPSTATETDKISIPRLVDVLWTSGSGSSNFQGSASLSGGGGVGVGVANLRASSAGGLSIDRTVQFASFNTYRIDDGLIETDPVSVEQLRSRLTGLTNNAEMLQPVRKVDDAYMVQLDLPPQLCRDTSWSVGRLGDTTASLSGTVGASFFADSGCHFSVRLQDETIAEKAGGFRLIGQSGRLKPDISYPVFLRSK